MSIYLGEGKEYSDMQGPCAAGFHIPTNTEWQDVLNIFIGFGIGYSNYKIYLKLPLGGYRSYTDGELYSTGDAGRYWSSVEYESGYIYCLNATDSTTEVDWHYRLAGYGCSIRPFKDKPSVPDPTRTTIYQGGGNAGVYHNSNLGLISISSDGTTWITIADKNLGATTVWNNGDTLSESNCGKYYQRGNNYGFDGIGGSNPTASSTQVNAGSYGPGNYYSSSTFITGNSGIPYTGTYSNLRGGVTQGSGKTPGIKKIYLGEGTSVSDMQGPCSDGFHVPTKNEWDGVKTILTSLGITSVNDYVTNLHIPTAGLRGYYRDYSISPGGGYYWTSTDYGNGGAYCFWIASGQLTTYGYVIAYGMSIRPFKNSFVAPTSGWTVITGTLGSGGIFWNQTDGIISVTSNGTTGYTIADKNLGATVVYNDGDTLSESNCGKYYQRGNNNGFPGIGNSETFTATTTQVDASSYGPGNYYSSSTYYYITNIRNSPSWDSSFNKNLRGGVTQGSGKKPGIKAVYVGGPREVIVSDMQGPCPTGFHVPLSSEWTAIRDAGVSLGAWSSSNGTNLSTYLKLPMAGRRNYSDLVVKNLGSYGDYWSASPNTSYTMHAYHLEFRSSNIYPTSYSSRSFGFSVRPVKNSPTVPTSSWTKLYGTSIESGGIFWNSADGLISISSDGTNWYTLMDKNLGATTVYNYGDTLTDANCGNVFQWGNNYAFPGTKSSDSITTSSTQVDVTGYGPGNYYESSTWITYHPRQSSANDGNNLRGGVSQGTSTKTVYNKVRPKE